MSEQGHPVADRIKETLTGALAPETLHVIDDSHKHAGHAHRLARPGGATGTSETHFQIKVVSQRFEGKTRLERHRIINALLAGEMGSDKVHALAIDARAPGE
jgi:BolA protein